MCKIRVLRTNLSFDLKQPDEALKFFIYLTEDLIRLLELTIHHAPYDSSSLYDCCLKITDSYDLKGKDYLALHYAGILEDWFVDANNNFVFDHYINDELSKNELGVKSRLNRLLVNLVKLINEVSGNLGFIVDYDEEGFGSYFERIADLRYDYEMKFLVYREYSSEEYRKVAGFPYRSLLYCFGTSLRRLFTKLTVDFSGYIDSVPKLKDNKGLENKHADIFKGQKEVRSFKSYAKNHFENPYKAFGYVYQRMLSESRIHRVSHMEFADFLLKEGFIDQVVSEQIFLKNQFDSLYKSKSKYREACYNKAFGI